MTEYFRVLANPKCLPGQTRIFTGRVGRHLPSEVPSPYKRLQFGNTPTTVGAYMGYELEPVTVLETPTIEPDTFIVGFALADGIMFEFDVDTVDSDANTVTGSFTHEHQFDGTTYATTATLVLPLEKVAITQVNPASWHQELRPC